MKAKLEEDMTALPTIPGIVYRCLGAVLGAIFIALLWSEGQKLFSSSMAGGNMSDRYVEYLIKLVFVIACLTAISGRFWGIHLVKVTSLWVLALAWAHIPETLYDTYMGLVHNYYPVSFSPRYIVLLLVLCFFSVAHIIEKRRLRGRYVEVGSEKNVSISEEVVMWLGVVLLILGCIFKWLWTIYLDTIPVASLVACTIIPGVILILGWAILHKEGFLVSAALSIAAILTVYRPVPTNRLLTILIWFLPIFFGILTLLQKRSKMRTCIAAILVPFSLMIYFYFVLVPLPMIRSHDKMTVDRPPDFPNCLRAPANATETIYMASTS